MYYSENAMKKRGSPLKIYQKGSLLCGRNTTMALLPKKKLPLLEVADFENFRAMLTLAKEEDGDTIAVKYKERGAVRTATYNELLSNVDALGTALSTLEGGLDAIAVIGDNSYRYITVLMTALCGNGVVIGQSSGDPLRAHAFACGHGVPGESADRCPVRHGQFDRLQSCIIFIRGRCCRNFP